MRTKYEFLPKCFAEIIVSNGYYGIKLSGDFPLDYPGYTSGDSIELAVNPIVKAFSLSSSQKHNLIDFCKSSQIAS